MRFGFDANLMEIDNKVNGGKSSEWKNEEVGGGGGI